MLRNKSISTYSFQVALLYTETFSLFLDRSKNLRVFQDLVIFELEAIFSSSFFKSLFIGFRLLFIGFRLSFIGFRLLFIELLKVFRRSKEIYTARSVIAKNISSAVPFNASASKMLLSLIPLIKLLLDIAYRINLVFKLILN